MKNRIVSCAPESSLALVALASLVLVGSAEFVAAQPIRPLSPTSSDIPNTTYQFGTSTAGTAYLNSNNWTGGPVGTFPGVDANPNSTADGTTADVASFGSL